MDQASLQQLYELLRIESVSSDGAHPRELRAAADWVADLIGDATVTEEHGNPLVDGVIPASVAGAPTVITYGHYDVQAVGSLDLWESHRSSPRSATAGCTAAVWPTTRATSTPCCGRRSSWPP